MEKKRIERVEVRFYQDLQMDAYLIGLLQTITERNNFRSLAEAAKYVLSVFTPAAALSEEFDLVQLQQKAIAKLSTGTTPTIAPLPSSSASSNAEASSFEPIQGF